VNNAFEKWTKYWKTLENDAKTYPENHPSLLGKGGNLETLRSGPYLMFMDPICMLWRHGMYCMEMSSF